MRDGPQSLRHTVARVLTLCFVAISIAHHVVLGLRDRAENKVDIDANNPPDVLRLTNKLCSTRSGDLRCGVDPMLELPAIDCGVGIP